MFMRTLTSLSCPCFEISLRNTLGFMSDIFYKIKMRHCDFFLNKLKLAVFQVTYILLYKACNYHYGFLYMIYKYSKHGRILRQVL